MKPLLRSAFVAAALVLAVPLAACASSAAPEGAVAAAPAGAAAPTASPSASAASTASTPLTAASPNGTPRLTLQITVAGGKSATVALDTGSTGLFVNADVVGSSAEATSTTYQMDYLSSSLEATLTTGTVEIAGVSTAAPMTFGVVQSGGTADIFDGLDGIMGVAPADGDWSSSGLLSPIPQLVAPYNLGFQVDATTGGAGTFTVGVPARPSGSVATPLTALSPAPSTPAGLKWWEKDVQLCWTIGPVAQACGPTDLDAGAPTGLINTTVATGVPTTKDAVSSNETIVIATPSGQQLWSVVTGDQKAANAFSVHSLGSQTSYNTGLGFFTQHVVGLDWQAGELVVTPAI